MIKKMVWIENFLFYNFNKLEEITADSKRVGKYLNIFFEQYCAFDLKKNLLDEEDNGHYIYILKRYF